MRLRRAIRTHSRDAVAIVALLLVGMLVTGAILARQSAALPSWVPLFGPDVVELHAELETSQGVVAGQGHSVNLAGVTIGTVSGIELDDGVSRLTLSINRPDLEMIHPDASILLRPRTGLQDMTVEVDPGREPGAIAEGATIELARTKPSVNVDQVLASLDRDTRAFLKILLAGGAEGVRGREAELSASLRRLEPTSRQLARVGTALEGRQAEVRRAVTAFAELADELAAHDQQLGRFVEDSADALGGFAAQESALREAIAELPGSLAATRQALARLDGLNAELEPALSGLGPVAKRTGPALAALTGLFEGTTPVIADELRPLSREIREPVRRIAAGAPALGRTTSGLAGSTADLADLLDGLAYNPEGTEEGYLFWLSWLAHNTGSLFTVRDASGPLRRGLVMVSCQTAGLAEGVAASRPFFRTALDLTRLPTAAEVC